MTRLPMSAALVVLVLLGTPWADAAAQTTEQVAALRQRAEQGEAFAQASLGIMYRAGEGIPQDYVEAVKWLRLAADQDHAFAQVALGFLYGTGEGVLENNVVAVTWYRLAADQGEAIAQHNLGVMYQNGEGVPQDYLEAHKWVNLAAARATGDDQKQYAESRNGLAKLMTSAQVAEAQRRAREWQAAFDARQK